MSSPCNCGLELSRAHGQAVNACLCADVTSIPIAPQARFEVYIVLSEHARCTRYMQSRAASAGTPPGLLTPQAEGRRSRSSVDSRCRAPWPHFPPLCPPCPLVPESGAPGPPRARDRGARREALMGPAPGLFGLGASVPKRLQTTVSSEVYEAPRAGSKNFCGPIFTRRLRQRAPLSSAATM